VQLGYELIKMLDKATEDEPEPEYFRLLQHTFEALQDSTIPPELIRTWFHAQLLKLSGHDPNLTTDVTGTALDASQKYTFSFDDMAFVQNKSGRFGADNIKFLRLLFSSNLPPVLAKVQGSEKLVEAAQPLLRTMAQTYIRL
jgi:recombinational DNA repair protein (RecF pathway)